MKTRCPACQTTFRVTPVQLKARAGKVRCGQCQTVFNALDSLLDEVTSTEEEVSAVQSTPRTAATQSSSVETYAASSAFPPLLDEDFKIDILLDDADINENPQAEVKPEAAATDEVTQPLNEASAQELGKATGLILPRETAEIPGYSKWAEGVVSTPFTLPVEKSTRWPFVFTALLLTLGLAGQVVFHFRSEIAVTLPSVRPLLETVSRTLNADLPLPRHVELVSIETSDLQADPAHGNLLVLNATLRNRASYGQAYPSLELSLTDTVEAATARRVFAPEEYLPASAMSNPTFGANADVLVRLWIEAKGISAAGYRLYVFYP